MGLASELRRQAARLACCGVDSPRLSAEILLAKALGMNRQGLLKHLVLYPDAVLTQEQAHTFAALADRRASGEPAAYIVGRKEFYGRDFLVTSDTLIPRPETELLVETALKAASGLPSPVRFADLGTGTGCIAITLGLELPESSGIALDKSCGALAVAADNAARLQCGNVLPVRGDFFSLPLTDGAFSLILSNPPYVSEPEYAEAGIEVRGFEPKDALVPENGSATGLEALSLIASRAYDLLVPGGWLVMEMGHLQGEAMLGVLHDSNWQECEVLQDLAGLDRILRARKPEVDS